tara:strand:+ start:22782 stop:24359 length:1578 start_codon:yes stop_codon:yes gene_type:complete
MANFDVAIKKEEVLKYRCKVPNGYVRLSSVLGSLPRYADDDAARTAGLKDCELYINEFGNITAFGKGVQSLSTYVSTFDFNEATNSLTVNLANGDVQQIDLSDLEVNDSEILTDFSYNQPANQVTLNYVDGTTEVVTVPAPPAGETISFIEYTDGTPNTITVTYSDGTTSAPVTVTGLATQTPVVQSVAIDSVNNVLVVTSIDSLGNTIVENIPLASVLDHFEEERRTVSGQGVSILRPSNNSDNLSLTPGIFKNIYIGAKTASNINPSLGDFGNISLCTRGSNPAFLNEIGDGASFNVVGGQRNAVGADSSTPTSNFVLGEGNIVESGARNNYVYGSSNYVNGSRNQAFFGFFATSPVRNRYATVKNGIPGYTVRGDVGDVTLYMKSPELNVPAGVTGSNTLRDIFNQQKIDFAPLFGIGDEAILNVDIKISSVISNSSNAAKIGEGFTANITGLVRLRQGAAPDLTGLTATSIASTSAGATLTAAVLADSTDELSIEVEFNNSSGDSINVRSYGVVNFCYAAI